MQKSWLDKQPERYRNINLEIPEKKNTTRDYLKSGLYFGIFMLVSMGIIYPLIYGKEITLKSIVIGVPLWIIGGVASEYTMKLWMNKKGKTQ